MIKGVVELVVDEPLNTRAERFMRSLAAVAPACVKTTRAYTGRHNTIVVYGPGAPARQRYLATHKSAGGRALLWDMAYWDRTESMRLAVDDLHPTPEHLALAPADVPRRTFVLREDADSDGPILLIGLGKKTNVALKTSELAWERFALAKIRERWPGRKVLWRPKGNVPTALADLPLSFGNPIEEALRGCAAVVCRHSNVAVDACVAGVPVHCEAGAAYALYKHDHAPSAEARMDFLNKLSWWEWHRKDAELAWRWMRTVIEQTGGGW